MALSTQVNCCSHQGMSSYRQTLTATQALGSRLHTTHIGGVQHSRWHDHYNKNYAGIGYTWDGTGFAAPQLYPSWTLNAETYQWDAPTPMPIDDKRYQWDEATLSWVEATF
jgi:hypothetical protein